MQNFSILVAILALILSACAPTAKERKYDQRKSNLGPTNFSDSVKQADSAFQKEQFKSLLTWSDEMHSADVFRSIESLHMLGDTSPQANVHAEKLFDAFYRDGETHTRPSLSRSFYVKAALGIADEQILGQIKDQLAFIYREESMVEDVIQKIDAVSIANQEDTLTMYDTALLELDKFVLELEESDVHPVVKSEVVLETKEYIEDTLKPAREPLKLMLDKEASLAETADHVVNFARAMDMEGQLSDENRRELERVKSLSPTIEKIQRRPGIGELPAEQLVLNALIKVWFFLETDKARQDAFSGDLSELYDFFKSDDADFECLTQDTSLLSWCGITHTIKRTKIFPSIRRFGIMNSKAELKSKFRAQMVGPVEELVVNELKNLPAVIQTRVGEGFETKRAELTAANEDLTNFASPYVDEFERLNLGNKSPVLFEATEVKLIGNVSRNVGVQAKHSLWDATFNAETHGQALSALGQRWKSQKEKLQPGTDMTNHRRELIGALNKILALGGFQTQNDRLVPGLFKPVAENQPGLDLLNIGKSQTLYGIPTEFSFATGMSLKNEFSVNGQAAVLNGLSEMLEVFSDWKGQDGVDFALGSLRASDLIADLSDESGQRLLFPRDMLYSLIVGQAAAMLKGIQEAGQSPLAMVFPDDLTYYWLGNRPESDKKETIVAVVDRVDGERTTTVKTIDLARFIRAVIRFHQVTEDIEKTGADVLTEKSIKSGEKDENGEEKLISALELIDENREQLKYLVIGLTNALKTLVTYEDGSLATSYDLNTKQKSEATDDLSVYLEVIAAYTAAKQLMNDDSDDLDERLYADPVTRIVKFMNAKMWDSKTSFYRSGKESARPHQVIQGVAVLNKANAMLPKETQENFQSLISKWIQAIVE